MINRATVHPHTRGKYLFCIVPAAQNGGSSPHAGEVHEPERQQDDRVRFIPTRGGNTELVQHFGDHVSVHPHTQGKYERQYSSAVVESGSSPHTGKYLPMAITDEFKSGPSPHAGEIRQRLDPRFQCRFIPTRGGKCRQALDDEIRSIPTRRGNTVRISADLTGEPVHPHTRGKYHNLR